MRWIFVLPVTDGIVALIFVITAYFKKYNPNKTRIFIINADQLIIMSWIRRIKRGNQIYLYEMTSVWENGKSKQKLIQYLGVESDQEKVAKQKTKRVRPDQLYPCRGLTAGDVTLLWRIAESLDVVNIIDRFAMGMENITGPSPGKYLTTWAINRILDPESATQMESWVHSTVLPILAGMEPMDFTKDAYLRSLDAICTQSVKTGTINTHIPTIESELYHKWRTIYPLPVQTPETIAFDLTPIPTYGLECPLVEPGSKTHETHLNQINLSVITSRFDSYPISHFVHPGSSHSITTIPDLIVRLNELKVPLGTILWDRGDTTNEQINLVETEGWKLICGITKRTKEAIAIIFQTDPPLDPEHLVPTQCMNIYAVKVNALLFGLQGSVVVYVNAERRLREMKARHCTLLGIQDDLKKLEASCAAMDENTVNEKIRQAVPKQYQKYFRISIQKIGNELQLKWEEDADARREAERMDGKYLLYATDSSLTALEIVRIYFEKGFVEKIFRDLKTYEEIAPLRHRCESRVLGILFVCTLALRLKTMLRTMLDDVHDTRWNTECLLKKLGRVQRIDLQVGNEQEIWYVNHQKVIDDVLVTIGMKDLFMGKVRMT